MSSEGHFLNRRFSLKRLPLRAARRNRRVARRVRSSEEEEEEEEGIDPGIASPNDREPRAPDASAARAARAQHINEKCLR